MVTASRENTRHAIAHNSSFFKKLEVDRQDPLLKRPTPVRSSAGFWQQDPYLGYLYVRYLYMRHLCLRYHIYEISVSDMTRYLCQFVG